MEEQQRPTSPPTEPAEPAVQAQPTSLKSRLRASEKHWAWKLSLRTTLCILDIVGLGATIALAVASSSDTDNAFYGFGGLDYVVVPAALASLCASLLWNLATILTPLLHKRHRPLHPGACVGVDLTLWLLLIVTGLFTVGALIVLMSYGSRGIINDLTYSSAYSGDYTLASNGTWVYHITSISQSSGGYTYNPKTGTYTYVSNPKNASDITRSCEPYFSSCAQQDKLVNKLWRQKPGLEAAEILSTVAQWIGVLGHFVLFVWACVDTSRRNRDKKVEKSKEMTEKLIQTLQERGAVTINDPALLGRVAAGRT